MAGALILDEDPWQRNREGGIIGILMHQGSIHGSTQKHSGGWEASGRHLGGIWEAWLAWLARAGLRP